MRLTFGVLLVLALSIAISFGDTATALARRWASPSSGEVESHKDAREGNPHAGHSHGVGISSTLSIAANGAVNPDAIADDLAYEHFLKALAPGAASSPRDAVLKAAGLLPSDRLAFWRAIRPLQAELDVAKEQRNAKQPLRITQATTARAIGAARARLRGALSQDGLALLDTYIRNHVKPRIVIYRAN